MNKSAITHTRFVLLLTLLLCLSPIKNFACSAFQFNAQGKSFFAKSFDFFAPEGHLIVNHRNVKKSSFNLEQNHTQWTSLYGSVTFNQIGSKFPVGGINEKGLVVEALWDSSMEPPEVNAKPTINESQWIQYILDTSANIPQAIYQAKQIRISPIFAYLHYMACDSNGKCAVFEYDQGKLIILEGRDLPIRALTNLNYRQEMAHFTKVFALFPHSELDDRFQKVAKASGHYLFGNPIKYAFKKLEMVKLEHTQWQIVYNLADKFIYFKFGDDKKAKIVDLNKLDFSNENPQLGLDLSIQETEDISTMFTPISPAIFLSNDALKMMILDSGGINLTASLLQHYDLQHYTFIKQTNNEPNIRLAEATSLVNTYILPLLISDLSLFESSNLMLQQHQISIPKQFQDFSEISPDGLKMLVSISQKKTDPKSWWRRSRTFYQLDNHIGECIFTEQLNLIQGNSLMPNRSPHIFVTSELRLSGTTPKTTKFSTDVQNDYKGKFITLLKEKKLSDGSIEILYGNNDPSNKLPIYLLPQEVFTYHSEILSWPIYLLADNQKAFRFQYLVLRWNPTHPGQLTLIGYPNEHDKPITTTYIKQKFN